MEKLKLPQMRYIKLNQRFILSHLIAFVWMSFSIYISIPWIKDLGAYISMIGSVLVIAGIAYIPGYINVFNTISLILERQPPYNVRREINEVSILISCKNEDDKIETTLKYIKNEDWEGKMKVYVIDNASTDHTYDKAIEAGKCLGLDLITIKENTPGKSYALNTALKLVDTDYVITLDADTLLHKTAVRHIINRMQSAPNEVCAVAGAVLARNGRESFIAKLQEWDYFLGIASIKRLQGIYQGTLVAQGAYSIYEKDLLEEMGGWPDCIGEDIVLTWKALALGRTVIFEPNAIAFTQVPPNLKHLYRQRSRWARGMIEALKVVKPWQQSSLYVKYLTSLNLMMPYLDIVFTLCFIPGIFLALFGNFIIVGPLTLLVLPIALIQNYILYRYQKGVFQDLGLKVRKNVLGLFIYVILYQMLMSPMALMGYIQEFAGVRRIWK